MEAYMKDSGRMIFSMAQENGFIQMVLTLLHFSVLEENMVRHNLLVQMAMLTIAYTIMAWKIDLTRLLQDAGTVLG